MSYSALIKIDDDKDSLFECLKIEAEKADRSEISIKKGKTLEIKVAAGDATSFRASMNFITRLLSVYDKVSHEIR
jgi:tRNA threonylcarbamoyladenosine modification (KEOPS) complex  Pcc1 subunit